MAAAFVLIAAMAAASFLVGVYVGSKLALREFLELLARLLSRGEIDPGSRLAIESNLPK